MADPSIWASKIDAFRQGLRDLGYEEGKNIVIEFRWAHTDIARLPKLAAELVDLNVDVLVTHATPGSRAAKEATKAIPIVMAATGDPVRTGLVQSLARPGGNVTGHSIVDFDLVVKRLELLRELARSASRVTFLYALGTHTDTTAERSRKRLADAAAPMGIKVTRRSIRERSDLAGTFEIMAKEGTDGVIVALDSLLAANYGEIARLAIRFKFPTIGGEKQFIEAGGLFAYGVDTDEVYRHAAVYVDKILKGAKPADLPVELPTKFELVVNMKTAKAIDLTVPQSLLSRAGHLIE